MTSSRLAEWNDSGRADEETIKGSVWRGEIGQVGLEARRFIEP